MAGNITLIVGIVFWGYALTRILKIKEGFGPVLSVAVSMAVLEIAGAFGVLWTVAKAYCIAVCIFSAAYIVRTKDKAAVKAYFLNPSIIGFSAAVLFYMILSSGKVLFYTELDSFLHWGMFSKTVFYDHNLDVWNSSLCVNHRVYPHGMASWYALFALGKNTYSERDVILSINVLLFASCCPIVDIAACRIRQLFSDKKIISLVVYLVSGMSVACFLWIWRFGEVRPYISGYMDVPLGAAFMAALCLAIAERGDGCYNKALGVSLISAMLIMIKPSGIIFVGVVCLVYLLNEYISQDFHMTFHEVRKLFGIGMLSVCIPMMELGIWNTMMKYLNITGGDQFRLKSFLLSTVVTKYKSDPAYVELFQIVIRNFFVAFFTREVTLHMSAFFWMILCIAIAVFTIISLKDRREKKKVLCVNICMLVMFCLYNLFLLWTYLTTMSEGEAVGIVCYDRYIGSYVMGWFVLCLYFAFVNHVGTVKVQYLYFGCFFICNVLGFCNRNTFLKEIDSEIRETNDVRDKILESMPEMAVDASGDMPDLWITYGNREEALMPDQLAQLKYYLFPDFDFINIYGIQENYQREMKDIIAEFSFDYVVLYGVNNDFYDSYYWFFADGLSNAAEKYDNGCYQAYKVIRDENTDEFRWFEPIL